MSKDKEVDSLSFNYMETYSYSKIKRYYNRHGYYKSLKYITHSEKVCLLQPSDDILKIIELALLKQGDRSIVNYLRYLKDKKRSILPSLNITINNNKSLKDQLMSQRCIKSMKAKVKKLSPERRSYLNSLTDVFQLNVKGLQRKSVIANLSKIKALYVAKIPSNNIDLNRVLEYFNELEIKCSAQDLISFISLITSLSSLSNLVNIPASYWLNIFSKKNVKAAKVAFIDLGILTELSGAIPGFKSTSYRIKLLDTKYSMVDSKTINLSITNIKTLERLNRINRFNSNFSPNDHIEALKTLSALTMKELKKSKGLIYIELLFQSTEAMHLSNDLLRMRRIIYNREHAIEAEYLGLYLITYLNKIQLNNFSTQYSRFYFEEY